MTDAVAITGMACRFAGASSPNDLWEMIVQGRTGHGRIPNRSFNPDSWYHPSRERHGAIATKSGFFLDDVARFDAPFFSVTAREAAAMDPMQRLGLEVAYEAFENAGVSMQKLMRSQTGVYSGVMTADYQEIAEGDPYRLGDHAATGTNKAILSNRISWFFDLTGPSLTLDTACSSGLYGLHLACQAIRARECDQALVTGTNLILHPNLVAQYSSMRMIGADGISHTFDESANGYGRGEGIAAVVVKRLSDALRDGDVIRAVVRGTGANHDGKTTSMTIPSEDAQAALIRSTYARAKLAMAETCYFEAHGTGTPQGDPIEMRAIASTIGAARRPLGPLHVGSVKTNVGHTEGAAGLAGLIKVVLCLETGVIPAVTGLKNVNPALRLSEWNLDLPRENMTWPETGPRRASVNSFGFGGANAHAILEDALHYLVSFRLQGLSEDSAMLPSSLDKAHSNPQVFVFSAHDQAGLERVASSLANALGQAQKPDQGESSSLVSLAAVLATRRSKLDFRSYVVADTWSDLVETLKRHQDLPRRRVSQRNKIAFVFTGQGAQRPGMARELLADPVFDASIWRSQKVMDTCGGGCDIRHILMYATAETIGNPHYAQPVCTAVQLALVDLLASWGIEPAAVVGHSSGEIAAAYAAGAISHEDAMYVAFYRGALSSQVGSRSGVEGCMLAAGLSESDAMAYLASLDCAKTVTIACINSPSSVTFSGTKEGITILHDTLVKDGKFARMLRTGVAYHSPQMAVIGADVEKALSNLPQHTGRPRTPMYSSVTEELVDGDGLNRTYWMENMLQPVRFAGALRNLVRASRSSTASDTGYSAIIEIGPSRTLQGPIQQILKGIDGRLAEKIPYRSVLVAGQDARRAALQTAGFLWATGHPIDLGRVNRTPLDGLSMSMLPRLPSYPWNHDNSFWHETASSRAVRLRSQPRTDLLGVRVNSENPFEPRFRNILSLTENPWLADHNIAGACLFPAAGYLVMALEAALSLTENRESLSGIELTNVTFETGLVLSEDSWGTEVFLSLRPNDLIHGTFDFSVYSGTDGDSVRRHVVGTIAAVYKGPLEDSFEFKAREEEWARQRHTLLHDQTLATNAVGTTSFYSYLESLGLRYGSTFQGLKGVCIAPGNATAVGDLVIPDTKSTMPAQYEYPHLLHPATLDSAFQLAFAAAQADGLLSRAAVPVSAKRIFVSFEMPTGTGSSFKGSSSVHRTGKLLVADMLFADSTLSEAKIVIESLAMSDIETGTASSEGTSSVGLRRSANIIWKEDVDFMKPSSSTDSSRSWLVAWLDSYLHKYADANILLVATEGYDDLLDSIQPHIRSGQRAIRWTVLVPSLDAEASLRGTGASLTILPLGSDAALRQQVDSAGPFSLVILPCDRQVPAEWLISSAPTLLTGEGNLVMLRNGDPSAPNMPALEELLPPSMSLLQASEHGAFSHAIASPSKSASLLSAPGEWKLEGVILLERSAAQQSAPQAQMRAALSEHFEGAGFTVKRMSWGDHYSSSLQNALVISLVEYDMPLIYDVGAADLVLFRQLVSSAQYVLWVTSGGLMSPTADGIKYAATTGLLRTVRVEYPQLALTHLDLSPDGSETGRAVVAVSDVMGITIPMLSSATGQPESEYIENGGRLLIPRLLADVSMDAEIALDSRLPVTIATKLSNCHEPVSPQINSKGNVQWVQVSDAIDSDSDTEAEADTMLITTGYACLARMPHAHSTASPFHASHGTWKVLSTVGTVTDVGRYVAGYEPGDTVVRLGESQLQTRFRADANTVIRLPSCVSTSQAAYWVGPLAVAYHLLGHLSAALTIPGPQQGSEVKLFPRGMCKETKEAYSSPLTPSMTSDSESQSILIDVQDAALRTALLLVAQWLDLETFVVVPHGEKLPVHLHTRCTVLTGVSRTVSYSMRNSCSRGGLDLVISSLVATTSLPHIVSSLAPQGQIITVGAEGRAEKALYSLCGPYGVHISSFSLGSVDRVSMQSAQVAILHLLESNPTPLPAPSITSQYSVSELDEIIQSGPTDRSYISLSFEPESLIPVQPAIPPRIQLNPTATYLISGGLGALGLRIATWLCNDYGARHVLLLSRSGTISSSAATAIQDLAQKGCRCDVLRCDITSPDAVHEVASQARKNGWSIAGIIQSAMVLADAPLDNMTMEKWTAATAPKIQGSWNLHRILGQDVAFFILLSSISGIIGNTGQSNYSAGNTFEDALAAHRRSIGLPALSLNLGLVADADTAAVGSSDAFVRRFPHLAPVLVHMNEVHAALGAALRGHALTGPLEDGPGHHHGHHPVLPHQIVVGISDRIQQDGEMPGSSTWSLDPKFRHCVGRHRASATGKDKATQKVSYERALLAAASAEDARVVVEDALRMNVAAAISTDAENIDVEKPITAYGIDSLKATDVRNWVLKEFKSQLSIFDVLSPMPISKLAAHILDKSAIFIAAVKSADV